MKAKKKKVAKTASKKYNKTGIIDEEEGAKIIDWFRRRMKLQNWDFSLYISDLPPEIFRKDVDTSTGGFCSYDEQEKSAEIWVSPRICKREKFRMDECLLHELFHVLQAELCLVVEGSITDRIEGGINREAYVARKALELERLEGTVNEEN